MCVVLFLVLSKCLKSNESTTLHTAGAPTNTANRNQPRKTRRTGNRNRRSRMPQLPTRATRSTVQSPLSTLQDEM